VEGRLQLTAPCGTQGVQRANKKGCPCGQSFINKKGCPCGQSFINKKGCPCGQSFINKKGCPCGQPFHCQAEVRLRTRPIDEPSKRGP
jgi:hypothetical protein